MNKKNQASPSSIEFTVPAFRHNGKEYLSADVSKAAKEGNQNALTLIGTLIKMGSGIVRKIELKGVGDE